MCENKKNRSLIFSFFLFDFTTFQIGKFGDEAASCTENNRNLYSNLD